MEVIQAQLDETQKEQNPTGVTTRSAQMPATDKRGVRPSSTLIRQPPSSLVAPQPS